MPNFPSPEAAAPDLLSPVPVILNPKARSARAEGRMENIQALSDRVQIHGTKGMGDAGLMAEQLARDGAPLIVAAGGDGTVNEVVNGVLRAGAAHRTAIGILPSGTMNVFAAELGLPSSRLDLCWDAIVAGEIRGVDLWKLNETWFVQLAGIGLDAAIIRETTWESKKRFGPFSYLLAGSRLVGKQAPLLKVTRDQHPEVRGTVVLIGNGRNYGGPFPLFPHAVAGDGLLDVVVMPAHGIREFYALGRGLLSGHYAAHRGIVYFQTDRLRVEADHPVHFEVDGELAGSAAICDIRSGGTLQVMVPRRSSQPQLPGYPGD